MNIYDNEERLTASLSHKSVSVLLATGIDGEYYYYAKALPLPCPH